VPIEHQDRRVRHPCKIAGQGPAGKIAMPRHGDN
jgi:hypothetical protein